MRNSKGNAKEEAEEEEKKKKEMIQVSRTEIPWGDISMEDLGRSKEKKEKARGEMLRAGCKPCTTCSLFEGTA